MDELDLKVSGIVGDSLISAAAVSYYGAFTSKYRAHLIEGWAKQCKLQGLPLSQVMQKNVLEMYDEIVSRMFDNNFGSRSMLYNLQGQGIFLLLKKKPSVELSSH